MKKKNLASDKSSAMRELGKRILKAFPVDADYKLPIIEGILEHQIRLKMPGLLMYGKALEQDDVALNERIQSNLNDARNAQSEDEKLRSLLAVYGANIEKELSTQAKDFAGQQEIIGSGFGNALMDGFAYAGLICEVNYRPGILLKGDPIVIKSKLRGLYESTVDKLNAMIIRMRDVELKAAMQEQVTNLKAAYLIATEDKLVDIDAATKLAAKGGLGK